MMDLKSGYGHKEVDDKDREKSAFVMSDGLYEFKVMPFGLCNAPATFERMMDTVLRGLKWNICLAISMTSMCMHRTSRTPMEKFEDGFEVYLRGRSDAKFHQMLFRKEDSYDIGTFS
ncbi:hypothetical protein AVEN_57549-1 [Araneus ventricosus]|uniref:Reverse transcriptase domain-containing protein n=1 Tax=Araneus ventricosus TaxID=182803 RepID=A0A4Y2TKZ1_ARAVE|nr:hypothetical protein AVEN_57549-1 [Araneus ventricosus]